MRIGAINWNAIIPQPSFFGAYALNTLSHKDYHYRLPYFVEKDGDAIVFPEYSQELADRELQYAIDAGLDYFAYVWYAEAPLREKPFAAVPRSADWHRLNDARRWYQQSALRHRLNMCAILRPGEMNPEDFSPLHETMQEPYYETLDGRPLVYLFASAPEAKLAMETLDALAEKRHAERPFFAQIAWGDAVPDTGGRKPDALTRYAWSASEPVATFADLAATELTAEQRRAAAGFPMLPHLTTGWNPRPRIARPVPWTHYPDREYAADMRPAEMLDAARNLKAWLETKPAAVVKDQLLVFAWNEFEEGGWLCPTLGADGLPDTTRLEAFAQAVKLLKALP